MSVPVRLCRPATPSRVLRHNPWKSTRDSDGDGYPRLGAAPPALWSGLTCRPSNGLRRHRAARGRRASGGQRNVTERRTGDQRSVCTTQKESPASRGSQLQANAQFSPVSALFQTRYSARNTQPHRARPALRLNHFLSPSLLSLSPRSFSFTAGWPAFARPSV
jgi:hypothetical protein